MKLMLEILSNDDVFDRTKQVYFANVLHQIQERVLKGDSYGVIYNDNDVKIAWFDNEMEDEYDNRTI